MKKKILKLKDQDNYGLTFKENCTDIRNSGIKNVVSELKKFKCKIELQDPWADEEEIKTYKLNPITKLNQNTYDSILLGVAHTKYKKMGFKFISKFFKKNNVIYDLKYLFPKNKIDLRL